MYSNVDNYNHSAFLTIAISFVLVHISLSNCNFNINTIHTPVDSMEQEWPHLEVNYMLVILRANHCHTESAIRLTICTRHLLR